MDDAPGEASSKQAGGGGDANPHAPLKRARTAGLSRVWESPLAASRLYQGDHLAFLGALEDASVDCIWTDPPYFLSNGGSTCVAGRRAPVSKGEWDASQGLASDHAFNRAWIDECARVLKPAGTLWVSGTHHVYLSVGMAMMEAGFRILNDIVWEKPNPPPNLGCRCFTHSTELILWGTRARKGGRDKYLFNYAEMKAENGDRQMKNVWRMPAPGKEEKTHGRHPTQKPVALVARCIAASTERGQLVVDPFSGSGTTAVAALGLGRRFYGSELDPDYASLARARIVGSQAER